MEAVEDVLDNVLGRFAGTPRSALQDIVAVWDAVTGAAWTGTTPARLADGTLLVEVPDGMTATRLQFEGPQVVRAVSWCQTVSYCCVAWPQRGVLAGLSTIMTPLFF